MATRLSLLTKQSLLKRGQLIELQKKNQFKIKQIIDMSKDILEIQKELKNESSNGNNSK
jgi:hypothetical protein